MKKVICLILPVFFLFLISVIVDPSFAKHATTGVGTIANGIASSRHNLSTSGWPIASDKDTGTTEICVFCHTPHSANTSQGPLWNKSVNAGDYTPYGTTNAGTVVGAPTGPTLACLSCHDGVTAFDALINPPGNRAPDMSSGKPDMHMFFHMQGPPGNSAVDVTSSEGIDSFSAPFCSVCHDSTGVGYIGYDVNLGRLNIGTNLTDDHPVSVVYNQNVARLRPTTTTISTIDLGTGLQVSGNLWDVEGVVSNTAKIADILYNTNTTVECTSCHDPHFKNQTNPDTFFWQSYKVFGTKGTTVSTHDAVEIDGMFLRRIGGNSDSGVCRTCHFM